MMLFRISSMGTVIQKFAVENLLLTWISSFSSSSLELTLDTTQELGMPKFRCSHYILFWKVIIPEVRNFVLSRCAAVCDLELNRFRGNHPTFSILFHLAVLSLTLHYAKAIAVNSRADCPAAVRSARNICAIMGNCGREDLDKHIQSTSADIAMRSKRTRPLIGK